MAKPRVLIVGAGVAGLALARALQSKGVTPEVVEKSADWTAGGSGLFLPGNALRALHDLGFGDLLAARANPIRRQRFLTAKGLILADLDVDAFWSQMGGCRAVHRGVLHEILRNATGRVHVQLGKEVSAVTDGATRDVTLSDGSVRTFDLVVGADGINSSIRRMFFDGGRQQQVGQIAWRFVATGFPEVADWEVRLGSGRAFLTVALGGEAVYCYGDADVELTPGPGGDWRSLFDDFAEPVPTLLQQGAVAHRAAIEEVTIPDWTKPGLVLIGDAAHACSPNMAQGVAMAVEDALVLAELVAASDTVDAALTAFVARRRARIEWVQEQTRRRDRMRNLPASIRNLSLRLGADRIYRANYRRLVESA